MPRIGEYFARNVVTSFLSGVRESPHRSFGFVHLFVYLAVSSIAAEGEEQKFSLEVPQRRFRSYGIN